jgi:hypothetical protein
MIEIITSKAFFTGLNKISSKEFLNNHPNLWGGHLQIEEIENNLKYLKKHFTNDEILGRPTSVLLNQSTIENRAKVLKECLFQNVQLLNYTKFVLSMNKSISMLKAYNYIHAGSNVEKNLIQQLDVPVEYRGIKEQIPLNELRMHILNLYMREKLKMTESEIAKTRSSYKQIKHRNLQSIVAVINILIGKLNFTNEKIIKNSFLLYALPENICQIIEEIPKIGNTDIQEIALGRPKVLMQSCSSIKKVVEHVKAFNLPESSIEKCLEVLTLSPDTVYNRLKDLSQIKEFSVMIHHPRVLRLIHYQNKAKTRLEYLKHMKVKCFSLHLLAGSAENFEKFAYEGADKTKGKEMVEFLSNTFKLETKKIRKMLWFHPHWLQVPALNANVTYDYLRQRNFSNEELLENVLILLYPISKIQPKLDPLLEWKEENHESKKISDLTVSKISNSKILSLCLYFIEAEYHFTGDAVFEMNKLDNKQDFVVPTMNEPPKSMPGYVRYGFGNRKNVLHINS